MQTHAQNGANQIKSPTGFCHGSGHDKCVCRRPGYPIWLCGSSCTRPIHHYQAVLHLHRLQKPQESQLDRKDHGRHYESNQEGVPSIGRPKCFCGKDSLPAFWNQSPPCPPQVCRASDGVEGDSGSWAC